MPTNHPVQLTLSEKQFKLLVELMHLSSWVVCAGEEFTDRRYRNAVEEVEQLIYRQAFQRGHTDLVTHEPDDQQYYASRFVEEESEAAAALEAYEEETFWEELISRLSTLYAVRETGAKRWERMSRMDRFKLGMAHEDRIREVFRAHGLNAISLISAESAQ